MKISFKKLIIILFVLNFHLCITINNKLGTSVDERCFEKRDTEITNSLNHKLFRKHTMDARYAIFVMMQEFMQVAINKCKDVTIKEKFKKDFLNAETMDEVNRYNSLIQLLIEISKYLNPNDPVIEFFYIVKTTFAINKVLAERNETEEDLVGSCISDIA